MIDFVLLVALLVGATWLVLRVRRAGFDGLRPPALTPAQRVAAPWEGAIAPVGAVAAGERDVATTAPRAEAPPRSVVVGWLTGALLLLIASQLQRQLWEMRGDLTPFWLLLAAGIVFA